PASRRWRAADGRGRRSSGSHCWPGCSAALSSSSRGGGAPVHAERASLARLLAGMAIPAALAGIVAAMLLKPAVPSVLRADETSSPRLLSRAADIPAPPSVPALPPLVIRAGRVALGHDADTAAAGA